VLDLGAAPGSWTLYAAGRVGAEGRVLAVDLSPIETPFPRQVEVICGDALDALGGALGRFAPYDVVLSDMAPRTSGTRVRDKIHSYELCVGALGVAKQLGRAGSHFVAKIFMSGEFPAAKRQVTLAYEQCRVIKPESTRTNSTEVFLIGLGLRLSADDAEE
jgi:23S rRNA (uridine2552-2'-O)-methyltransferase